MRARWIRSGFSVIYGTGIGGIRTFEIEHQKLMEKGPGVYPLCLSP